MRNLSPAQGRSLCNFERHRISKPSGTDVFFYPVFAPWLFWCCEHTWDAKGAISQGFKSADDTVESLAVVVACSSVSGSQTRAGNSVNTVSLPLLCDLAKGSVLPRLSSRERLP